MSTTLRIKIFSFSYKLGVPIDSSERGGGFIFDCRALPNPGREERFKQKTGLDPDVIEYIEKRSESAEFRSHTFALAEQIVSNYLNRNFTDLMLCYGCTGGQHRSVYFAQSLAKHLAAKFRVQVSLEHRELKIKQELP